MQFTENLKEIVQSNVFVRLYEILQQQDTKIEILLTDFLLNHREEFSKLSYPFTIDDLDAVMEQTGGDEFITETADKLFQKLCQAVHIPMHSEQAIWKFILDSTQKEFFYKVLNLVMTDKLKNITE